MINTALTIAIKAHKNQKDLGGDYYIFHPLRVMAAVKTPNEKVAAILHDVLEDSNFNITGYGFNQCILDAVSCLTKMKNEKYSDYIMRLSYNDIARNVKIADLEDNMDITRLNKLTEIDYKRLSKYQIAWANLMTHF